MGFAQHRLVPGAKDKRPDYGAETLNPKPYGLSCLHALQQQCVLRNHLSCLQFVQQWGRQDDTVLVV